VVVLETRTTAYVDILGFSDRLARATEREELLESIARTLRYVQKKKSDLYAPLPEEPPANCLATMEAPSIAFGASSERTAEMSAVSDCFAISDGGPLAYTVVARAQELAFTLLEEEGFLCRGGIVKDGFYHHDGVAFGPALIRAHDLEDRVANYPRIVVDDALAASYFAWEVSLDQYIKSPPPEGSRLRGLRYPRLLDRDGDGCYFVNLFVPIPDVVWDGWRLDGDRWPKRFRAVKAQLAGLLEEATAKPKPNPNHLANIRWLVRHFNTNVGTEEFRRRVAAIEPIPE
jgi:hypothetical protein